MSSWRWQAPSPQWSGEGEVPCLSERPPVHGFGQPATAPCHRPPPPPRKAWKPARLWWGAETYDHIYAKPRGTCGTDNRWVQKSTITAMSHPTSCFQEVGDSYHWAFQEMSFYRTKRCVIFITSARLFFFLKCLCSSLPSLTQYTGHPRALFDGPGTPSLRSRAVVHGYANCVLHNFRGRYSPGSLRFFYS